MQTYCHERKVGSALGNGAGPGGKAVELPAAIMERRVEIDSARTSTSWDDRNRDAACEIVVPMSVLEELGKDVYAGQLVCITASTCADVRHVARLVPVDLCATPPLSPATAAALDVDTAACTIGGKAGVLLSPMLAFNLGIEYQLAQLLQPDELKRWVKRCTVKLTMLPASWPDEREDAMLATPWVPGNAKPLVHAATHVALAHCLAPERSPPFNVTDAQEDLKEAAAAMQGKEKEKEKDEVAGGDDDALSKLRQELREDDTMKARPTPLRACRRAPRRALF